MENEKLTLLELIEKASAYLKEQGVDGIDEIQSSVEKLKASITTKAEEVVEEVKEVVETVEEVVEEVIDAVSQQPDEESVTVETVVEESIVEEETVQEVIEETMEEAAEETEQVKENEATPIEEEDLIGEFDKIFEMNFDEEPVVEEVKEITSEMIEDIIEEVVEEMAVEEEILKETPAQETVEEPETEEVSEETAPVEKFIDDDDEILLAIAAASSANAIEEEPEVIVEEEKPYVQELENVIDEIVEQEDNGTPFNELDAIEQEVKEAQEVVENPVVEEKPVEVEEPVEEEVAVEETVVEEPETEEVPEETEEVVEEETVEESPTEEVKQENESESYLKGLIAELKQQLEEQKKVAVVNKVSIFDKISQLYPYLSGGFIRAVYDMKDAIAKEYEDVEVVIILHRAHFRDVDKLRQFVEIVSNHDYTVNVDENKMIVDVFKEHVNSDGRILTNIFEIANQAKVLEGEYEGYRVVKKEDK